jgi:hypothetical protein
VQFHAEVTRQSIDDWLADGEEIPGGQDALLRETESRIDGWNTIGRRLCSGFVEAAERVGAPA